MEVFSLILLEELIRGVLGKIIGIGLVFSVAKSTISQSVSFPNTKKLEQYKVKLLPSVKTKVDDARRNHLWLMVLAWLLVPTYWLVRWYVMSVVPEGASDMPLLAVCAVYGLIMIALMSLCLSYYLSATESNAKDLVLYGKLPN